MIQTIRRSKHIFHFNHYLQLHGIFKCVPETLDQCSSLKLHGLQGQKQQRSKTDCCLMNHKETINDEAGPQLADGENITRYA